MSQAIPGKKDYAGVLGGSRPQLTPFKGGFWDALLPHPQTNKQAFVFVYVYVFDGCRLLTIQGAYYQILNLMLLWIERKEKTKLTSDRAGLGSWIGLSVDLDLSDQTASPNISNVKQMKCACLVPSCIRFVPASGPTAQKNTAFFFHFL